MPRTNYQKGADKERRIVNKLKKAGCITFRSAGSHSIIDVVGIHPEQKKIKLIQSKLRGKENLCRKERERIVGEGMRLNGYYFVNFELWD